ncbi:MAG: hypothetical protein ACO1O6_06895 [Bacteroidota bacterium]
MLSHNERRKQIKAKAKVCLLLLSDELKGHSVKDSHEVLSEMNEMVDHLILVKEISNIDILVSQTGMERFSNYDSGESV